jgi:tetratricopeptide (TPR) repeat protein
MRPYAWQLPYLLQTFFAGGVHWADWADTHQAALAAADAADEAGPMAVALANSLGECHAGQRRYHEALVWFRRALTLCDEDREPLLAAACLRRIAEALGAQGLSSEAAEYLDRARVSRE